jgi:hypothetical protein
MGTVEQTIVLDTLTWAQLLVPPDEQDMGSGPEVRAGRICVKVGEPVAISLRDILEAADRSEAESEPLGTYDVWMIFHSLNVEPPNEPAALAYEVSFTPETPVLVTDIAPHASAVTRAHGRARFSAWLDSNAQGTGEAIPPPLLAKVVAAQAKAKATLAVDGEIGYAAGVSFEVKTHLISTCGLLSTESSWWLRKAREQSLLNDHILSHTIWVPAGAQEVRFLSRLRAAVPIMGGLLGAPLKPSEWVARTCRLRRGLFDHPAFLKVLPRQLVGEMKRVLEAPSEAGQGSP